MRYFELIRESDDTPSFYDPETDQFDQAHLDDTRKPKLTLRMVNRLKKMRSVKALETVKKQELLGIMYGIGDEEE